MVSYDKKENIEVDVIEAVEDFEYKETYSTDTEKGALVKRTEALIRASMEYSDYISFLRENVGMDACAFFNNVSKANGKKIRIEIHHAPLTLFDITKLVVDRMIDTGEEINALLIAERVMEIHYRNKVGLIPLSKTIHEVVHNSEKIKIPLYMIYGNLREFIKEYADQLEKDENKAIRMKLHNAIELTKNIKADSFDTLKTKFTYLKVDGFELPVKIDDVKDVKKEVEEKKTA